MQMQVLLQAIAIYGFRCVVHTVLPCQQALRGLLPGPSHATLGVTKTKTGFRRDFLFGMQGSNIFAWPQDLPRSNGLVRAQSGTTGPIHAREPAPGA